MSETATWDTVDTNFVELFGEKMFAISKLCSLK